MREDAPGGLTPDERRARMKARAWALQVHYQWEAGGKEGGLTGALGDVRRTRRVGPERLPYLRWLVEVVDEHLDEIDRAVSEALENWRLERLSSIDRGVLRISAAELLHMEEVPPTVAVSEGVRLAARYGGEESPRFVNGVLDALRRRAEGEERD